MSLSTQQKPRICHFGVPVDTFASHHSSQRIIDELVEWHFSGIRHDRLNGSFATLAFGCGSIGEPMVRGKSIDQLDISRS